MVVVVVAIWETDGEERPVLTRQVQSLKAFSRQSRGLLSVDLRDADSVHSMYPVTSNTKS